MEIRAFLKSQPPFYENRLASYPQFMVIALRKGLLFMEDDTGPTVVRPGSMAVLRRGSRFRLHTQKEGYEGIGIEIRPPDRPDFSGESAILQATPLLTHLVEGIFQELTRPSARGNDTVSALSRAAVELCLSRLEEIRGESKDGGTPEFWASQLKSAIHGALHTSEPIEAIAARSELSYRQMARHFKAVTGLSPKAYQLKHKVAEAEHLLCATDFSATQVALEMGFPSSQHFSRAFKKVTGKVPGAVRASGKGSPSRQSETYGRKK